MGSIICNSYRPIVVWIICKSLAQLKSKLLSAITRGRPRGILRQISRPQAHKMKGTSSSEISRDVAGK